MSRVVYLPLTPVLREACWESQGAVRPPILRPELQAEAAALAEATLAAREAMRRGAAAPQGRPNAGAMRSMRTD